MFLGFLALTRIVVRYFCRVTGLGEPELIGDIVAWAGDIVTISVLTIFLASVSVRMWAATRSRKCGVGRADSNGDASGKSRVISRDGPS